MSEQEQRLKALLTGQKFEDSDELFQKLEESKELARSYAVVSNGIAVLSDFYENASYIYSGQFGRTLGIDDFSKDTNSSFECEIFNKIPPEELLERHILELRFYRFLEANSIKDKSDYKMVSFVHFNQGNGSRIPVLHCTRYIQILPGGSVWLGLCTYVPFVDIPEGIEGCIVNQRTGESIQSEQYKQYDCQLLSARQLEVLSLLAKGEGSKQIAEQLCISVNTVSRHRQNILTQLNVTNTAAAVKIGLRMHLI